MAGRPVASQARAIEEADADALTLALLQTHIRVLAEEAYTTGNRPRFERLTTMYDLTETMRLRVVARKS
jgi:hypothetical protein